MRVVKILEKKPVIRMFGIMLLFSPMVNILISMMVQKTVADKWTMLQIKKVIDVAGTATNVLTVCSILLGLVMLTGSKKAWKFALVLLGGFIAVQLLRLDQDMQNHWISGVVFLINVIAFAFIADQLVFKQKFDNKKIPPNTMQPKAQSIVQSPVPIEVTAQTSTLPSNPPSISQMAPQLENIVPVAKIRKDPPISKETIFLAFDKQLPWAKLLSISSHGLEIRAIASPPEGIESRDIEIQLGNSAPLLMHFTKHSQEVFHFEFKDLNSNKVFAINSWLNQKSKAA